MDFSSVNIGQIPQDIFNPLSLKNNSTEECSFQEDPSIVQGEKIHSKARWSQRSPQSRQAHSSEQYRYHTVEPTPFSLHISFLSFWTRYQTSMRQNKARQKTPDVKALAIIRTKVAMGHGSSVCHLSPASHSLHRIQLPRCLAPNKQSR